MPLASPPPPPKKKNAQQVGKIIPDYFNGWIIIYGTLNLVKYFLHVIITFLLKQSTNIDGIVASYLGAAQKDVWVFNSRS